VPDVVSTTTAGLQVAAYQRGATSASGQDQYVVPREDKVVTYRGRAATYLTPGRATGNQPIFAIHNATGSAVLVSVNRIVIDLLTTVIKAATLVPPFIRVYRFTALPTGGTALTKSPLDTQYTSSASVTCWGDATSVENAGAGTSSATALAVAVTAGTAIGQVFAPRMITAASYEPLDEAAFFMGEPDVILRPLQGMAVVIDIQTAGGNPTTDKWSVFCDWTEYTRP
jgi:hypothetical protein